MPIAAPGDVRFRVAVDVRSLVEATTGISRYTSALLAALMRDDDIGYLGLAHRPPGAPADSLRASGLEFEVQPAPLGVFWQQLRLPRRLRRGDIDLFWSPLLTLPRQCPVPSVVTVHDLTPVLYPEMQRLKVRLSVLPFLERTIESATFIVTGSQATADELRFHFPNSRDRLEIVHHGVAEEFHPADEEGVAATRRRLGAPEGYILYVGAIEPRKNLSRLLDAWEVLKAENPRTLPLVLAGPYGWHSRGLLRRIRSLEAAGLRRLGRLPESELVSVFQAARVFVYPSLYEGFGLPPLEAMACGIPTLVSNASSLSEIVGDAGIRIDATDTVAWAHAIRQVLHDEPLAEDLQGRALERAAGFSWSRAAAQMRAIFERAVALQ